jgi:serine protease inhibitor
MKQLRMILPVILLVLSVALSSCSGGQVAAADLMKTVKAANWPASPGALTDDFRQAAANFSWRLLQESVKNPGNILISPASVYLALAMTINGADGTTREAMLNAMAAQGLGIAGLNEKCRDWITLLTHDQTAARMAVSNSIWYRTGFSADPAFLKSNADYFAAGARVLDFSKPEAVDVINGWVNDATHGTIDKILEKIDPAVVMYLINTIYFKADWKTQFVLNLSASGDFAAPEETVQATYMHRLDQMDYLEFNGSTGVLLPYAGDQFAFFAVLPEEGVNPRQLVAGSGAAWLNDLLGSRTQVRVDLSLPRFETKYEDSLINECTSLGMGVAFQSGQADFSLMQTSRAKDLFISEIKHKTFIKLNEVGTEAAAATEVELSKSVPPPGDKKIAFNRPFIYGIVDQATGLPLFIGILEKPA